jgi:hypothetical protein
MAELDDLAGRLREARDRLHEQPVSDSHEPGPPDPRTGERWDRFNVLGHTAEMLPFWSAEIGKAVTTGARMGREPGSSSRLEGIESGRLIGEPALRERIDAGVDSAVGLLAGLQPGVLENEIETYSLGRVTVRHALEHYLVGHFEDHVRQLGELG